LILRWFWLLVGLLAFWLFRRWLHRSAAGDRPAPGSGRPAAKASGGGRMVRDRVCNTFVPRSSAIVHRDADGEHYFCSESCRDRFLSAAPDPGRPEGPSARN